MVAQCNPLVRPFDLLGGMMELQALEQDVLGQIAAASDEAALETLRVATLGKKGSISERMKSLGAMNPDQRRDP